MSTIALSEQVKGLPKEIVAVLNRLSETCKIIAQGYETRTPEQFHLLGEKIQSFNDGVNEFSQENFTADIYYQIKAQQKKFLKKIRFKCDPFAYEMPAPDPELPKAQFIFTRDLTILKALWHKYFAPYWEWHPDWDKKLASNNEVRPVGPYWIWHSGLAEAPDTYRGEKMHSKDAKTFSNLNYQFMDPAEYIIFMIEMRVMEKILIDKKSWTMSPRSRWSSGKVPDFYSTDDEPYVPYVNGCNPFGVDRRLHVRPVISKANSCSL